MVRAVGMGTRIISPAPDVNYFCGEGEAESFPSFENMKGKEGQDLSGCKGPQEVSGKKPAAQSRARPDYSGLYPKMPWSLSEIKPTQSPWETA